MRGESGSKFYYGHMDKVLIKGGQKVRAGEVIALMGDTGSPGAVHLHFEYWCSGGESAAVDPEDLINRVCKVGQDGKGDALEADPKPVAEPAPKPQPAPDPVNAAIVGEVFAN
jgi:pyruvate/2-oxoglutarate dehydrogenase complex dihydrolipoamide acyltransferase (E2) component